MKLLTSFVLRSALVVSCLALLDLPAVPPVPAASAVSAFPASRSSPPIDAPGSRQVAAGAEFFVSPAGSDRDPGSLSQPFASLEGARDAIRRLRRTGRLPSGPVTVLLRGGTYSLARCFELEEADSGSEAAPVTYRAYRDEEVHLSGGRELSGFAPVTDEGVLGRLPEAARGRVLQVNLKGLGLTDWGEMKRRGFGNWGVEAGLELFFRGEPMPLAGWPNEGWAKVAAVPAPEEGVRFGYDGERPGRWSGAEAPWLHGYWTWDWADGYLEVVSIDRQMREITTRKPPVEFGFKAGARYRALNMLEELDQPGEWYLDRRKGLLYFWPPAPLGPGSVTASLIPSLISLKNTSHLTIRGITVEYCRGTAVTVSGGRNNRIAGCTVRNAGIGGIVIDGGSANGVVGCDIYQVGEGGLILTGGDRLTLTPGGNYALNNDIHHFGRWVRTYTPGIAVNGVGNRVANNLVRDAPHTAILLHGNEHLVEYNEIRRVCLETSDVGAFYMGRDYSERGNQIRYNYFHDIPSGDVTAIYLDDFASGNTVFGNVVYRAGRALQLGGGRDNTVENNLFVECPEQSFLDIRGLTWYRKYFDGTDTTLTDRLKAVNHLKPPYSTRYPELVTLYQGEPALPEGNAFLRNVWVGGPPLLLKGGLKEPTVRLEGNLVGVDPGFENRAAGDLRLKQDAPAYRHGFRRIPMERIGLYRDEFRK